MTYTKDHNKEYDTLTPNINKTVHIIQNS